MKRLEKTIRINQAMETARQGMVRTKGTVNYWFYAKILNNLIGTQVGL